MTTATTAPPCTSADLDGCTRCGRAMHRRRGPVCHRGHPRHKGFGLCANCHSKTYRIATGRRPPTPRRSAQRDYRLEEWELLARSGTTFRDFPRRVGMTYTAWERAFLRARAAGHPLARRFDRGA